MRALTRRYAGRRAHSPGPDKVFRRFRPGVSVFPAYFRTSVHLWPRLALALWAAPGPSLSAPRLERTTEIEGLREPAARRIQEIVQIETFVRQQVARTVRVASVVNTGRVDAHAGLTALSDRARQAHPAVIQRPAPPIQRIVKRASAPPATDPSPPRSVVAGAGRWPAWPPDSRHPPPALSPVELDRVTEHVVQTIDRRVSAHRERQGRA